MGDSSAGYSRPLCGDSGCKFADVAHRHVLRRAIGKVGDTVEVPGSEVERWVVRGEPREGELVTYAVNVHAWGGDRWN